jgi:hypothetical protein
MATITKTVDTDGVTGDYSSLSAWEAGEQTDLVAAGNIHIVSCQATTGVADTTACTVNGWTTGASNYIQIQQTGAARHSGTWDSSLYRLELTDSSGLYLVEDYVRVDGLQIASLAPTANGRRVFLVAGQTNGANDIRLSNSIIKGGRNATYWQRGIDIDDTDTIFKMWNCIVYEIHPTLSNNNRSISLNCATADIYNNTIYEGYYGVRKTAGTITVKNCAVCATTDDFNGTPDTIDYCASDDGDGTNAQTLDSTSNYVNEFTDAVNGDFHLVSGSVCVDNGVDDPGSGLYSDDIDGDARATWDIGADEYIAAAGADIGYLAHRINRKSNHLLVR